MIGLHERGPAKENGGNGILPFPQKIIQG